MLTVLLEHLNYIRRDGNDALALVGLGRLDNEPLLDADEVLPHVNGGALDVLPAQAKKQL